MPKTKWKLRSDRKENKGCPLIILADMDRKDLTEALDLIQELKEAIVPYTHDKIEPFLNKFKT